MRETWHVFFVACAVIGMLAIAFALAACLFVWSTNRRIQPRRKRQLPAFALRVLTWRTRRHDRAVVKEMEKEWSR